MHLILFGTIVAASMLAPIRAMALPSTSIADYVLLAGQELNARNLVVESGDVAVNAGELRSLHGLHAGSSRVAADQVDIDPVSTCSELYANVVVKPEGGCGPAAGLSGPIFPDIAAACGFPSPPIVCDPSRAVGVAHKQTQTLPPGVYGDLFVAGGSPGRGTLILEGGEYVFCGAHLGPRARLLVAGAAKIEIAGDANFGLGSFTGPRIGSGLGAGDLSIFVQGTEARFVRRADLVGRICVPDGRLWFQSGTTLEGQGVGLVIKTGHATVRSGTAGATTTTLAPTTTSTSSSTSSTVGGTTSTSTTSTSSVPMSSTSSTTGPMPSTTSTSTTSTTSTTGQTPGTTSTSTTSTSSTSAPGPSTSSTSTTSTTSTTIGSAVCGNGMTEAPETCDDGNTVNTDACPSDCRQDACEQTENAAVVLSVNLVTDGADTFGVGTVFIDYPEGLVFIPGSADDAQVQAAITDRPTTGSPTCLVNDRDHGLQFGCLSTGGFSEGLIFRAAFRDCQNPTAPTPQDFSCTVLEASDTIGFPVTATCSLQIQ